MVKFLCLRHHRKQNSGCAYMDQHRAIGGMFLNMNVSLCVGFCLYLNICDGLFNEDVGAL